MTEIQANPPEIVLKSNLSVLDQEINTDRGLYRVRAGDRVHYLTIPTGIFDDDTMGKPFLLIQQLPDFPDTNWTRMTLSRGVNGTLAYTLSSEPLPEVNFIFHKTLINCLSLPKIKYLRPGVLEVLYNGRPAIAKYSCFDWDFYRMHRENWAYQILHQGQAHIAPRVLGHLTINGRPIGLLLEKLEGTFASIKDKAKCEEVLRILHAEPLRLIHGDVNRYNFIVDTKDSNVRLIDFEHAEDYDEGKAKEEIESLTAVLQEETGRGSVVRLEY
ncbi:putative alpha-galactosidase a [Phaeomoniella chlamydospora]|uniref:Putative alpha-galactosidase a n=1 Tax=Phaeomoniella chlamydospora TaxID=158046 RepID=A0A0G2HCH3_PHACM|nr:putative alpha-galactosidase a [Phaeomoniella chlamydospora]